MSFVLGGCAQDSVQQAQPKDACAIVAAERAKDAGYNGFNAAMQKKIYDAAYKNCTAWARRGAYTNVPKP